MLRAWGRRGQQAQPAALAAAHHHRGDALQLGGAGAPIPYAVGNFVHLLARDPSARGDAICVRPSAALSPRHAAAMLQPHAPCRYAWRGVVLPSTYPPAMPCSLSGPPGEAMHGKSTARASPRRRPAFPGCPRVSSQPPARRQRRSSLSLTDFALSFRIRRHAARPGGRSAWPLAIRANPPRRQRLSRTGRRGV